VCLVTAFLALLVCYTVLKKSVSVGRGERERERERERGKIAPIQELFELFEL